MTALYPVVIQQSFDLFTAGREDLLWAIPIVIVVVTALKALARRHPSAGDTRDVAVGGQGRHRTRRDSAVVADR